MIDFLSFLSDPRYYKAGGGNRDGEASQNGPTKIKLTSLPPGVAPVSVEVIAILEYPIDTSASAKVYSSVRFGGNYVFTYKAPDIEVTSPAPPARPMVINFDATSTFVVLYGGPERAIGMEGSAPSTGQRVEIAGVSQATGLVESPDIDALGRVSVIVVGGSTPIMSTWNCTAAENPGDTVYNLAGVARQANAGAVATMPVIGVILSKPDATHAVVVSAGDLTGVMAGLVPGAWYYAGIVLGTITTTVPTLGGGFAVLQALGYAKTATDFVVDRQPQIVL